MQRKINNIYEHNQGMFSTQILTNVSEDFVTARGLKAYGYKEVNLNLGCPSKPVVNGGRGSGFGKEGGTGKEFWMIYSSWI